ncbi:hypothetical protein ACFL41_00095 [Gemmatimonadota bacterium]
MAQNVYLLDDEAREYNSKIITQLFKDDYNLITEEDPVKGRNELLSDYDLKYLILDLVFKDTSGVELPLQGPIVFRDVHAARPYLPICILSNHKRIQDIPTIEEYIINPDVLTCIRKDDKQWPSLIHDYLLNTPPEFIVTSDTIHSQVERFWDNADKKGGRSESVVSNPIHWLQDNKYNKARIKYSRSNILDREVYYYLTLPPFMRQYHPAVYHHNMGYYESVDEMHITSDDKLYYYVMEDIAGDPLLTRLFNVEPNWHILRDIQGRVLSFFQLFHSRTIEETCVPASEYLLINAMKNKLAEALVSRDFAEPTVMQFERIQINGIYYKNWPDIVELLDNGIDDSVQCPYSTKVHGDPHFKNIIVTRNKPDTVTSDIFFKLLDPKGLNLSDPLYDYGKLYQSISGHGHVDASHRRLTDQTHFDVTDKSYINNQFFYHFFRPSIQDIRKHLLNNFIDQMSNAMDNLNSRDTNWRKRFLLILGRHYICASQYFETPDEFIVLYCEGIKYLNEFVKSLQVDDYHDLLFRESLGARSAPK